VLEHAWREEPTWAVAPGYLAISAFQQSDWPDAARWARVSLAANPDNATISHILAGSLAEVGQYAEAIRWREITIANGEGDSWEQWLALARLKLSVADSVGARAAADSARAKAATPEQIQLIGTRFTPYAPPSQ
jgi:predicted Zn-dependent protease